MFAELTSQLSRDYLEANDESPVLIYANLDFGKRLFPLETRRLLDFIDEWRWWGNWSVLEYLEKHQNQFRKCLDWISKDCITDLTDDEVEKLEPEYRESFCRENWERKPEVEFLTCHGLEHIKSQLCPTLHDGFVFKGLEIDPGGVRDPLDPVCWLTLLLLKKFGTGFVRRCEYAKCKKFIFPGTKRKHFCSNSCRAQHHALEERRRDPESFRRRRAEYMRENRRVHRRRRNRMSKRNPRPIS